MKALFKVGDKVRVVRDDGTFVPEMREYIGKICTIESVESSPHCEERYTLEECGVPYRYVFLESALEKAEFTKKDLQEFDIVELRNGVLCLVNGSLLSEQLYIGECHVDTWEDDLSDSSSREYDVLKVYRPLESIPVDKNDWSSSCFCIWTRRECREMTLSEISKALGYDVKVVEK